jgi:3-hydroxyisobutyrate dehydrogenase-like beta-hydroxyacid dehydrogenase
MGGHMTSRLLDAVYELTVFDTSPEATKPAAARGAKVVGSPAEVASDAETVLMCLPMPDIVRAVAIGERGVPARLEGAHPHRLCRPQVRRLQVSSPVSLPPARLRWWTRR